MISSGSYRASIEGRNAHWALEANMLEGYFTAVDHVFFPSDEVEQRQVGIAIKVHDVGGPLARSTGVRIVDVTLRLVGGVVAIGRLAARARPDVVAAVDPFISG